MPILFVAAPLLLVGQGAVPVGFYNRPGATQATLSADLRRCRTITTGTMGGRAGRALTAPVPAPGTDTPPPGADPRHPISQSTIEDCMITRGWRLYALDPADRAALEALAPDGRARALARLTGARCPHLGTLRRREARVRVGPAQRP